MPLTISKPDLLDLPAYQGEPKLLPRPTGKRPQERKKRYAVPAVLACILGSFLAMLAWPEARAHLQALGVLMQMNGDSVPPILRPLFYQQILIQDISIPGSDLLRARVYRPRGIAHPPGMILLHGVYFQGMNEERISSYAKWMASCGLEVVTPDLAELRDYRVTPESIQRIGQSTRWLASQTGAPVGLMGISFSGGLALVAASQPQNASSVKFVFTTGTFDDMQRLAGFYQTGREPLPDGTVAQMSPLEYGPDVLVYDYIDVVMPVKDRAALRAAWYARLIQNDKLERQLVAGLTAPQRAELASLSRPAMVARAVEAFTDRMQAISPHGHLQGLRAPVFLLHGDHDSMIPAGETDWLVRDLPPGTLRAKLSTPLLTHVGLTKTSHRWTERWEVVHFFAQVIETAEAKR